MLYPDGFKNFSTLFMICDSRDQFFTEKRNSHSNRAFNSAGVPRNLFQTHFHFLKHLQQSETKMPTEPVRELEVISEYR